MLSTATAVQADLRLLADPEKAQFFPRFFKAGPGGYAQGDQFIGVTVPHQRVVARRHIGLPDAEVIALLASPVHEDRLTGLIILVLQTKSAEPVRQDHIAELYLKHRSRVNNWDLVDVSARDILGPYFTRHNPAPLYELAVSASLWDRRIAIITTYYFIRRQQFDLTFDLAELLINDPHDLIHKAVGWMLREVGNRDLAAEEAFLATRYHRMPRTMLRYAIEKFDPGRRADYLSGAR